MGKTHIYINSALSYKWFARAPHSRLGVIQLKACHFFHHSFYYLQLPPVNKCFSSGSSTVFYSVNATQERHAVYHLIYTWLTSFEPGQSIVPFSPQGFATSLFYGL